MRISYRKAGSRWVGVIKSDEGQVLAECGHTHTNRDQSSRFNGRSATDCARELVRTCDVLERVDLHRRGLLVIESLRDVPGYTVRPERSDA